MTKNLYVVANWKMYKTARESTDYLETLIPKVKGSSVKIYLAVPFTSIATAAHYAKETNILIGAQNMNDAREGAFTGEIAGLMLKEAGASFVLLGHSERRRVFGETDPFIHQKLLRALQDDIQPVLCVGETAEERQKGKTEAVLREQLSIALEGVPSEDAKQVMVAYEPVWAIGTGQAATEKHIQEAHVFCRSCLEELFGAKTAQGIPILYGGSVKLENVAAIASTKEVDGVLVGGASLDPEILAEMISKIEAEKPKKSRVKKEKTK